MIGLNRWPDNPSLPPNKNSIHFVAHTILARPSCLFLSGSNFRLCFPFLCSLHDDVEPTDFKVIIEALRKVSGKFPSRS